jgi:hypothetical protein
LQQLRRVSGKPDELLTPTPGFAPIPPATQILGLYIAPEGDIAITQQNEQSTARISVYRFVDGSWTWQSDVASGLLQQDSTGSPSRGPQPHLIIAKHEDFNIHELVEATPGAWQEVRATPYSILDLSYILHPALSSDGLRLTLYGSRYLGSNKYANGVMYAARPSIDVPFGKPTLVVGPPIVTTPFMTDDCARLYFTGLQSIFYVNQR